jgi:hypothetical protein
MIAFSSRLILLVFLMLFLHPFICLIQSPFPTKCLFFSLDRFFVKIASIDSFPKSQSHSSSGKAAFPLANLSAFWTFKEE